MQLIMEYRLWLSVLTDVPMGRRAARRRIVLITVACKLPWIVTDIVVITKLYPALGFMHIHFVESMFEVFYNI